jgi:hypothetical protein
MQAAPSLTAKFPATRKRELLMPIVVFLGISVARLARLTAEWKEMVKKSMALTKKDLDFFKYLVTNSRVHKIPWEPTAESDEFTSSFKGKYNVVVSRSTDEDDHVRFKVVLKDNDDRELLSIHDWEMPGREMVDLWVMAQRESMQVDQAIDEILGDFDPDPTSGPTAITDDDIPF